MPHSFSSEKVKQNTVQKEFVPPRKYQVILHNDDKTTTDFVVDVLMRFFGHDEASATKIMLTVHNKGKGVCGVYSAEIAETKVHQVITYAKKHKFPLKCTMEKAR